MTFVNRYDRDLVLGHVPPHPPFTLVWSPWRRTSMASAGAFTFRVLVEMQNILPHARSVAIAERILGSSCVGVEIAPSEVVPEDDDRM